ncbi:hypothetical protein KD050_02380 [Psychrobacillus sp. INOP01]|uniref:hypothetical protein n=1 Tax=Psychrobacillus sp. INOP01 TaxID=2829187 RepID=UPI001BABD409|nr:hypothetical protein [Psychrobacillus sp. INOP01]QUG42165.1 hypothetical protein KD050_02380 [Psychrobacillus sp. INOP01]
MNIVFMVIFTGIAITVLFKAAHLLYLLFKLGFSFEVIKFLVVLGVMTTFSTFILVGTDFSTAGFIIFSLIGGAMLPSLSDMTKMKPKSHYGKKKPVSVSESNYAWSYYGGGNGDCGNVGFSNGSASFNSDSGGDCGGGGGD